MGANNVGKDKGKYLNVNIAWEIGEEFEKNEVNYSNLGNNEYKNACDNLLFPMIKEFNPDIILISCGFDSAIHDPLGKA